MMITGVLCHTRAKKKMNEGLCHVHELAVKRPQRLASVQRQQAPHKQTLVLVLNQKQTSHTGRHWRVCVCVCVCVCVNTSVCANMCAKVLVVIQKAMRSGAGRSWRACEYTGLRCGMYAFKRVTPSLSQTQHKYQ